MTVLFILLPSPNRSEVKEGSHTHPQQFACKYYVMVARSRVERTVVSRKRNHKGKGKKPAFVEKCEPVFDHVEWEILHKVRDFNKRLLYD